ncbi:nucleotide-binding protein [Lentzea alba]|uniref:TIR domain-containing protein n=1 Tax=Lentzea alba TaxID=2714351 RepID=UPI0039BF5074
MEVQDQLSRLDELIDQIPALDQQAARVQIDDFAAGARIAKELGDTYDEWFTTCLLLLPDDLREKFRFEYEGSPGKLQYRIRQFLHEPVKPRLKVFGGGGKRPSEFSGLLGYWQHPYADRFQAPLRAQKRLLMEARGRLAMRARDVPRPDQLQQQEEWMPSPDRDRTVFVIHGVNEKARRGLFDFLRALKLEPMEWTQVLAEVRQGSPRITDVITAVMSKGCAIVVLATPDDTVQLRREYAEDEHDPELEPMGQARPDVIYQTGMAMLVAPERTILVELGKGRRFANLDGHFVVKLNNDPVQRKLLAQRLKDVGCAVDTDATDWLAAGDLTPPASAAEGRASAPASARPRPRRSGGIELDNFTVAPDHTVHGEAYNDGGTTKHLIIKVTFYDADRRILGTGNGALNDLAAKETKTFTLRTLDDVSGYDDFKVQIDAAF